MRIIAPGQYAPEGRFLFTDEYNAVCSGVTVTTAGGTLCEVDLGSVVLDERLGVYAQVGGSKTLADGWVQAKLVEKSGTATILFMNQRGDLRWQQNVVNGDYFGATMSGVAHVTVAGTLIIHLWGDVGVNSANFSNLLSFIHVHRFNNI